MLPKICKLSVVLLSTIALIASAEKSQIAAVDQVADVESDRELTHEQFSESDVLTIHSEDDDDILTPTETPTSSPTYGLSLIDSSLIPTETQTSSPTYSDICKECGRNIDEDGVSEECIDAVGDMMDNEIEDVLFEICGEVENGSDVNVECKAAILFSFNCGPCSGRIELLTDNFGSETTWEVRDSSGDSLKKTALGKYESRTSYTEKLCLWGNECFNFIIYDSYGDGLTRGNPGGHYKLIWDDEYVITGGGNNFTQESTLFGACDEATSLPSSGPTGFSTSSPTENPTPSPILTPTETPTSSPTYGLSLIDSSELPAENDSTELPENYFLPAPNCSFDETNSNTVGDFICTFTGIMSPNHASVLMKVLAHNCISAYNKTLFGETVVTPTTSLVTSMTSFEAIADVDPSSGHDGDVEFCIRVELLDSTNEVMWYRSEQAKLSFSYNGSFIITEFETNPYEGTNNVVTSAKKNFGVTADVCDANGTVNLTPAALSLGTNLFVCIRTIVLDTKIQSISSFDAEKKSGEDFVIKIPSPNVVVRYLETSSVQVVIKLPALFFANSNNINLSGTVVVTPNSRRHLVISRDLQVQTENADFGLVVPVNEINDDSFLRMYYGDSSTSRRAIMIHTTIFGIFTMCLV